jgi:hypothetical protein
MLPQTLERTISGTGRQHLQCARRGLLPRHLLRTNKTRILLGVLLFMTKLLIQADLTKGVRVNAADIAQPFRDDIQRRVKELQAKGEGTGVSNEGRPRSRISCTFVDAPLLVGLLANDDPAAGQYAE